MGKDKLHFPNLQKLQKDNFPPKYQNPESILLHFQVSCEKLICLSWPMNHQMTPTTMEEDQARKSADL